jgi:small subunit ribosomal protein S35
MAKEDLPIEDRLPPLKPSEVGLFAEDDPDTFAQVEDADDDWDESMITSIAESELQLHREIREYTRMAAWDMPLLTSKLTNPSILQ